MEHILRNIVGFVIFGLLCLVLLHGVRAAIKGFQFYARNDSGPGSCYLYSIVFGATVMSLFGGVTLGLGMYWKMEAQQDQDFRFLLMYGYLGLLGGLLFGTAVTCACAPAEFLAGPAAKKWRKLIGTDNIAAARAVCVALASLIGICYVYLLRL